jgi:membrane-associated phospholipid phosphatase
MFLNIAILSPLVLALDKQVRKDWLNLTTMFLVTHSVNNALYFAGAYSVRRYRPLTYSPGLPLDQKIGDAKTNSFFSGHVSFSATSTFFAAKVYTDYHHIRGGKRLLFYSAAAVPPLLVGYFRMQAGKHFRTDVGLGLLVGAASGILVPELHRKKNKHIAIEPLYIGGYSGLTLNVGF